LWAGNTESGPCSRGSLSAGGRLTAAAK
jgi:hypothetical protein